MPMTASPRHCSKRVVRRADVAEVARVDDDLDAAVVAGESAQDLYGAVGRGVVDEQVLVGIAGERFKHLPHALAERRDVAGLVVARSENRDAADFRHCKEG